jgi:outer membrane protein assembly factor BamB
MKMNFNKTKTTTLALILILTFSVTTLTLSTVSAHEPAWTIPTYSYIIASPNPVGIGQECFVLFWVNWVPPGSGGLGGDRWRNLKVEVTKPDGTTEMLGPFTSDPIGGSYAAYTPDQIGTYTFEFTFPGQVPSLVGPTGLTSVNPSLVQYVNDTFLPSSASTTLTVQQDPISRIPDTPLPTEYWTRPIEGQNVLWASIASNYLGENPINIQPEGIAPNSPHIMWTKLLQDGGIVGGYYPGVAYYFGDSYEIRFNYPMIINGRLYYDLPLGHAKTGGGYMCVDLYTGETIWYQNWTSATPSFGQIYDYESINQHGVIPNGILWRTSGRGTETWEAYDSLTGSWMFTITDVPSGTQVTGSTGEILRYIIDDDNNMLYLWNNTEAQQGLHGALGYSANALQWRPNGKTVNMSQAFSWNATIPDIPNVGGNPTIQAVIADDMLFGSYGSGGDWGGLAGGSTSETNPGYTLFALSLNPASRGSLLWSKDLPSPSGLSVYIGPVDTENRVFTTLDKETMQWSGYSLDNGNKLWGPVGNPRALQWYSSRSGGSNQMQQAAYGNLYVGGFGGLLYCYDIMTGQLKWTYGNGGPGNSTNSGLENVWGNYITFIGMVADGKIYTFTEEHSVNTPIYKGARLRCIDAITGEEIWTVMGYASSTSFYSRFGPVADGYLAFFNGYDGQVYCIGKGPSQTTVTAAPKITDWGDNVLIEGTVLDIAAGTKQTEQAGRFPNGVPAIADEYMTEWMEYVYMQKQCPEYYTGVDVKLETFDPNGNFYEIGTVTCDASGKFKLMWEPPVPGEYTIYATFEGSESYYTSYAETAIGVDEAPSPGGPIEPEPTEPTEAFALGTTELAIIAVVIIAVLGIVSYWILRKRK